MLSKLMSLLRNRKVQLALLALAAAVSEALGYTNLRSLLGL